MLAALIYGVLEFILVMLIIMTCQFHLLKKIMPVKTEQKKIKNMLRIHEASFMPPNGVMYDTPQDIVKLKDKIMLRVVITKTMPQNNKTALRPKNATLSVAG